jgi:hypothetical protein
VCVCVCVCVSYQKVHPLKAWSPIGGIVKS